ncbi:MAG: hypothetical protein Q9161_005583 [Pseudevernia consocians]
MGYLQTDEGSAVEATKLTADATSPDDNWAIKVYKSAVEGKPGETVAKDLSREEDRRGTRMGRIARQGQFYSSLLRGETTNAYSISMSTGSSAASLLEHEKPTSDNPFVAEGILDLRCTFFAGDDNNLWNIRIAPKEAMEQDDAWETVVLNGGDVFICHFLLHRLSPEPLIDLPEPLLPASLRSWNWFQKAYVWGPLEGK